MIKKGVRHGHSARTAGHEVARQEAGREEGCAREGVGDLVFLDGVLALEET